MSQQDNSFDLKPEQDNAGNNTGQDWMGQTLPDYEHTPTTPQVPTPPAEQEKSGRDNQSDDHSGNG